jgi:3-phosphoshikimate 1-carboxyvinyltransferase
MRTRSITPAAGPLEVVVRTPGSKSVANRALVCAALAEGASTLTGMPEGDDVRALVDALRMLGASIQVAPAAAGDSMVVAAGIDRRGHGEVTLNAHLAGTTSRFLLALAALRPASTVVDGAAPLRARPVGDLVDALVALGADVEALEQPRSLPLRIRGGAVTGGRIRVPGSVSSQFISALAMIGPLLEGGVHIDVAGRLVSAGYVELTAEVMAAFGAVVTVGPGSVHCAPGSYGGTGFVVPPDASSATYPAAAVAIAGGRVRLVDLALSSSQPDSAFPDLLERMGCQVTRIGNDIVVMRDHHRPLVGIDVDMGAMSDAVPALAVVAAYASTPTNITGIGFIRGKESDRIGDLAAELRRCKVDVVAMDDGLVIAPSDTRGAVLGTHHDHRLAMAFAVFGLGTSGVGVEDPDVVSKSWPSFWDEFDGWSS